MRNTKDVLSTSVKQIDSAHCPTCVSLYFVEGIIYRIFLTVTIVTFGQDRTELKCKILRKLDRILTNDKYFWRESSKL